MPPTAPFTHRLLKFFAVWPLPVLHALGGGLGWAIWLLSPAYRARFRANVAQAQLPAKDCQPAIAQAGRFVAELPKLWLRPPEHSCLTGVVFLGLEQAELAFAAGRGVIFFGPHCGSFELGPQALAEHFGPRFGAITAIYRPARQTWLAKLEQVARQRPFLRVEPASLGAIRLMHQRLKANHSVAMLTDQVPPGGIGLWAPFFGKPAYTMTLAARMALQTGAALLPVSCERLAAGRGYVVHIRAPVAGFEGPHKPDLLTAVTRINQAIEAIVRSQPGQYLWGYNRYKSPRGADNSAPTPEPRP